MTETQEQPITHEQLSFAVGGTPPDTGIVRITGGLVIGRDLDKGTEVHLQLVGMDGEVIANGYGHVVAVTFKDTYSEGVVVSTDRVHTLKIS